MKLNLIDIEKNMLPNTAKNLSDFKNFPVNVFLIGVRKKICTAPFVEAQELHSQNTLKANVCIFLYISLRKFLFQRRRKVLSGDGGGSRVAEVWRLNNFLKTARCLGFVKFFILIEIFGNSAIF